MIIKIRIIKFPLSRPVPFLHWNAERLRHRSTSNCLSAPKCCHCVTHPDAAIDISWSGWSMGFESYKSNRRNIRIQSCPPPGEATTPRKVVNGGKGWGVSSNRSCQVGWGLPEYASEKKIGLDVTAKIQELGHHKKPNPKDTKFKI